MGNITHKDLADRIEGATDSTEIGNVGDRLKVDANISGVGGGFFWDKNLIYKDATLARNTVVSESFQTVYSYSGTGFLIGFVLHLDNVESSNSWHVRLIVDNTDIFIDSSGISAFDLYSDALYDYGNSSSIKTLGFTFTNHNILQWHGSMTFPTKFSSGFEIQVKKLGGDKQFKAGLINYYKES